jgi:hypothetical protein
MYVCVKIDIKGKRRQFGSKQSQESIGFTHSTYSQDCLRGQVGIIQGRRQTH